MSLLVLLPLLLALAISLGLSFFIFKRKSLAQAICVQEVTRMQESLRKPLRKLVGMNPRAATLRARRQAADENLRTAMSSGVPYAIAAAQANQAEVILEQIAFHAKQLALLAQAQQIRAEGQLSLRSRAAELGAMGVQSQVYYFRPLAVEPKPVESLSPDYKPITTFEQSQQQRYRYSVNLLRGWPSIHDDAEWVQKTECSATLRGESERWDLRILAAKASQSY